MSRYTLYKYSTRLVAVLLCAVLFLAAVHTVWADGESGSCGDNLTWSLSAGTLTITGSGEMSDFPESTMAPWYHLREEILRVQLPDGLTSVGYVAFYGCENLLSVVIPNSVTRIGGYAFAGCTDMRMLNLGSGVQSIGEGAFSDCYALAALQLPGSLRTIGKKAFYRCESIPNVTVPSGVTSLGDTAFGYCKSLVVADIQANIGTIPEWLFFGCASLGTVKLPQSANEISEFAFYGCGGLSTVYYDGAYKTPEEISQIIASGNTEFSAGGLVTEGALGNTNYGAISQDNPDGSQTQQNTTVIQGENVTVSSTVTNVHPQDNLAGDYSTDITVTVDGETGWQDATDGVNEVLKDYNDAVSFNGGSGEVPKITVYIKDAETIEQGFLDNLAGRDVIVTIITQDGSSWQVRGADMEKETESESYDLRYTVEPADAALCEELGVSVCYVLRFQAPAQINAEVLIRLNPNLALQDATLLQAKRKATEQIQTTVVDSEGYAHFYLASVDENTEYYIAMNLPQPEQEPIIPEAVQHAYGNPEMIQPMQYEITGRTSSWGMGIGQVTWILVAVMVGSIVVVGAVIFLLNKRKLKRGYVPSFEDDE